MQSRTGSQEDNHTKLPTSSANEEEPVPKEESKSKPSNVVYEHHGNTITV